MANRRQHRFFFVLYLLTGWTAGHTSIGPLPFPFRDALPIRVSFPEAQADGPNTVRLPFRVAGHLLVVRAMVNGISGNMILDTGAEGLVLNHRFFPGPLMTDTRKAVGLTGEAARLGTLITDRLDLAGMTWPDVRADVVDLTHLEDLRDFPILGLLGAGLFDDVEVFIDMALRQITLTRLDARGERLDSLAILDTPLGQVPFRRAGHLILLEMHVGDRALDFGFDTGAEINMIDRRVRRRVFDHFEILRRVNLRGSGHRTVEAMAGRLYRAQVGAIHCPPMATLLTNLDEFSRACGTRLDGLLGYEFLADQRISINFRRQLLTFYPSYQP